MLAKELITDSIPSLKTSDTAERALLWMSEFRVNHLPIINNEVFLGLISEADLLEINNPEEVIGNHTLSLEKPFVYQDAHIYRVIRMVSEQHLSVVPVLDDKNRYLGVISMHDLVVKVAGIASIKDPGGILVLEMGMRDYSLAELARIVEENNARVLSSYITTVPETMLIHVTLKINQTDLRYIIKSMERYNYRIIASYQVEKKFDDTLDRFEAFMKYLNM